MRARALPTFVCLLPPSRQEGKLITIWAPLYAGTMISVREGQRCKHSLLFAFSNRTAACRSSRKLVTDRNCKVRTLRSPFSNADFDLLPQILSEPQKLHLWPGLPYTQHVSHQGRFRSMFDLSCSQPRDICRCESKPQRQRKDSPVLVKEVPFDPQKCTNALLWRKLSSCVFGNML